MHVPPSNRKSNNTVIADLAEPVGRGDFSTSWFLGVRCQRRSPASPHCRRVSNEQRCAATAFPASRTGPGPRAASLTASAPKLVCNNAADPAVLRLGREAPPRAAPALSSTTAWTARHPWLPRALLLVSKPASCLIYVCAWPRLPIRMSYSSVKSRGTRPRKHAIIGPVLVVLRALDAFTW